VATTRPETMLGDTAIAVNPNDDRYANLVGKLVTLPLADRKIPIIADEFVDPKFGTGMVKVTPAHDPNDYWIGQRHNAGIGERHKMPFINILDPSARLNENVPKNYQGMDHLDARKAVVRDLEAEGLLLKTEPYVNSIGHCYRCDTVVQPYLSDQWFVKMKPLAEQALNVVLDGKIRFYPDRWTKVYEHWMTNIRDWCISRQLWWGHRIPVWYCTNPSSKDARCKDPIVAKAAPSSCPHCNGQELRQDEDVLDTWFSSMLWPVSTLGWPNDNPDLRYFYPTNTLITAPDIIFFWVARMIIAGIDVMGEIPLPDGSPRTKLADKIPFRHVYFTSIIRDGKGRKMSKSLGNSPDPLDVIAEYGADALRFTIVYLAPLGQDVLYDNEKCEMGRNFANKIWNAGRFLLMNKDQIGTTSASDVAGLHCDLADRWILSRLHSTIEDLNKALDRFEINQATKILYEFIWHDFCDWYVEMIKARFYGDEPADVKTILVARAISIFDQALRMLHPFMPFVTEELWQHLEERKPDASLIIAPFPVGEKKWIDKNTEDEMAFVQNTINSIRNVRGELAVPPSKEIELVVSFPDRSKEEILRKYGSYFQRLARVVKIGALNGGPKPKHAASAVVDGGEVFIPLEGLIDLDAERERIRKELTRVQGMVDGIEAKLANQSFVSKAPKEVVEKEREKLETFRATMLKLQNNLNHL
ncbi:MAG TPA: valine--tRNA ligase, partial [Bacteroidota bacterium]|nr:valine--tRNA ligase [Bacteroidota bacterium]